MVPMDAMIEYRFGIIIIIKYFQFSISYYRHRRLFQSLGPVRVDSLFSFSFTILKVLFIAFYQSQASIECPIPNLDSIKIIHVLNGRKFL